MKRRKFKPETLAHNRERDARLAESGFLRIPVAAQQLRTTVSTIRTWVYWDHVKNQKHDGKVYVHLADARAHQHAVNGRGKR